MTPTPKFLTNEKGEKIGVVVDIREYERMLEQIEELESIRAYDAAKVSNETPVSFQHAMQEIKRSRK